jgi:putative cell wall-binding protein
MNEEIQSVFREISAAENEKRLAKVEAESSSEKCGTYEIALDAALWKRLLRTTDSVKNNNRCRKMAV